MAHSAAAVPLGALEQGCPIRVEHDRRRRQFTVRLNGCHDRAVLLYEYVGKRIVDLQHTEVPDAYRGRGIAKHLAKAALDFVVEEDLKAHLTCWYIQKDQPNHQHLPETLRHPDVAEIPLAGQWLWH
ncbi:protein NATD1 isoform X1 [Marmota monax]|uniref:protein NATD1 isoform X6 n=1 Tax=Marmota flaviventris TaxID=93162 RepID=UPI000FFF868A|nr:protein NATD1 isoform X6 [Marmota flaviventris]XP_046312706.1 protein NATD1 isoform X1 [Marmota monax]